MSGKEIVLCNIDEATTDAFKEKFEKFFTEVHEEEKYETVSQEETFSEDESSMEVQSKFTHFTLV